MKFSIIIPCYKVEKYLSECVDSVLNQTFTDYEIILVDDGSPDRVPEICDEYAAKDNRIRVIHQKNGGLSRARNAGISAAKGEYIICIDSDDFIANTDVLARIAEKTKLGTDVVLYGYQKLFESNNSLGERAVPILNGVCSTSEMLFSVLTTNSYCGTAWTKAVKLSILHEHKIEFRPGMISEDIDWYLHLMCYAKTFDSINDVAIVYRQRPGSISHSAKLNSLKDNLWILENWPERINKTVKDQTTIEALMSVMAYYYGNAMVLFSGYDKKVTAPYKERMKAMSYLQNYAVTPRARTIKRFYKLFGFDITIFLLKILANLKTRQ
ncbi:glycosyltransferase family 2 protein [Bacteroides ovatus]|uniref:glycosyltransferase family 2 protein n=1 Tax=Bacteroides ovatus TaxID=28116 RepID=UPI0018CB1E08|nr:glycosyltransferase [Bacteroides ovatus]MBG9220335.1 glycosyltransferase [Bacteroides ovatus]MBG9233467.1 glycosyltransferase [Bacteroides ovatus]